MTKYKFKQGDKVTYRGVWGTAEESDPVEITSTGTKNGERVYGLSDNHWCYENQICGKYTDPKEAAQFRWQAHADRDELDLH